jgi:hypothetical protein
MYYYFYNFYDKGVDERSGKLNAFEADKNSVNNLFKRIAVDGDGNCFFHAVYYYLNNILKENKIKSSSELRESVCQFYNYLYENQYQKWTLQAEIQKKLKQENEDTKNKGKKSHQERICENKEWAVEVDIHALSLILEKNIFVFIEFDGNFSIFPYIYCNDFTTPIINLYFNGSNHFDVMGPIELITFGGKSSLKSKKTKKIKHKKNKSRRKHVKNKNIVQ